MIAPLTESQQYQKESDLPKFAQLALRAHRRAARKLRAEHKRLGLPLIVWKDGKVVERQP